MARDSAEPPPNMLSTETLELLRSTVTRFIDDESRTNGELTTVLHRMGNEARERHMRPEELVVAFKEVLDSLPNGATSQEKLRRARLRERLVSLCIRAYFGAE